MIVGIDYETTDKLGVDFVRDFARKMIEGGNQVVMVSTLLGPDEVRISCFDSGLEAMTMIFAESKRKLAAVSSMGFRVDIWLTTSETVRAA